MPAAQEAELQNSAERFRNSLTEVTPGIYVTAVLLAINVLVFLVMTVAGAGLSPTSAALLRWGADFGPRTTNGEWWRLLTSTFVHIGFLHIAFNMFAFCQIGPLMERMMGNLAFAAVYLICGLAGSIASLTIHPYVVSAGASGAIFGLYGALIGYLTVRPKDIPQEVVSSLSRGALSVVGYNVIWGAFSSNTDMAGHAGGLICGYACGLAMSLPITLEGAALRPRRLACVGLVAAVVLPAAALRIPRSVDPVTAVQRMGEVEKQVMNTYRQAMLQYMGKGMDGAAFADVVEKQVLPPWNAQRRSLSSLERLNDKQQRLIGILVQYMDARTDAWTILLGGLRENNAAKVREGLAAQAKAARYVQELQGLIRGQSPGQLVPIPGKLEPQTITVRP